MKKLALFFCLALVLSGCIFGVLKYRSSQVSGAPPYGESLEDIPFIDPLQARLNEPRPEGPPRVGLQVGHWKNQEVPEELERLKKNTGASGGGTTEVEVNTTIAETTATLLREKGITVDILPTTIPPGYRADAFVAIHADGNPDKNVNGFKVASPWREYTKGKTENLRLLTEKSYLEATELAIDPNISRNMRGYYAFSFWKFEHAIHPLTPAVIFETGFLTSPHDQQIIVQQPQLAAAGLARGIGLFLEAEGLLAPSPAASVSTDSASQTSPLPSQPGR